MLAREAGKGLVRMVQVLDERKQDWPPSITTLVKKSGINKTLKRGGKDSHGAKQSQELGSPKSWSCRKNQGSNLSSQEERGIRAQHLGTGNAQGFAFNLAKCKIPFPSENSKRRPGDTVRSLQCHPGYLSPHSQRPCRGEAES